MVNRKGINMRNWNLLTLLAVIAIVVTASLHLRGQPAGGGEQPKTALLDVLKPGQTVSVKEVAGRYEITVFMDTVRPLGHKVISVSRDHVRVRDITQIVDTLIPVYAVSAVKIMRIGTR